MNAALMGEMTLREPAAPSRVSQGLALLTAIGLHVALGAVLLTSWTPPFAPQDSLPVLRTQLVSLPVPVEPQVQPAAPVEPQLAPPEPPALEPVVQTEPAQPAEAELAFKRAEKQRAAEEVRQQKLREQRETAERQAREAEQLRLEQEAERAAEAQRRLEAEQARAVAAEQARREAAAADRQYLPIAKEPPVYPQRALDSGVQGECTVSYDVDPSGRVVSPQVAGQCHPLFIRPSLNAAKRFRYRPRIVNGQAGTVHNVQHTFPYRIE